ncbi:hypothetical protein NEOLEDRAFT_1127866 [Neolentinus lepideus HHB14362 ss-1]|uniref:Transmembrane protein n=1 Tax=Neolentinus lepideus HHB14362 ss-1 TaxID=1314782 RepID=A0A165VNU8_9AGAM|nr:hypothetical protein NEOLEDRAFT_1127866 [Neolentinus lepideus HHB14362 ss-1]
MSVLTTTIDNVDPLINYSPSNQWPEGARDTAGDPYFARYSNGGTFTLTTTNGAYAEFTFNGTDVTIFGAKRSNHGLYSITLDNASVGTFNGSSNDPVGVWGPLYTVNGLAQGSHTVRITHAGNTGQYLDVDYITFNSSITSHLSTVDDTDYSSFIYPSTAQWSTSVANASQYNASTGHITCLGGGTAFYIFQGDAVQLYGVVGPNMGQYEVSVDGGPASQYNAQKQYFAADTMLYAGSSLGSGQHNLSIVNVEGQSGCLSVDYALASPAKLSPSGASASAKSSSSHHSSTGAVVGGVVAAIVVLIAIAVALLLLLRRNRRRASRPTPGQMDFTIKDPFSTDVSRPQQSYSPGSGYPLTVYSQYQGQDQGYQSPQQQQYYQHHQQQQSMSGTGYFSSTIQGTSGTVYSPRNDPEAMPDPHDYQQGNNIAMVGPPSGGYTSPTTTYRTQSDGNRVQSTYMSSASSSSRSRDTGRGTKARYVSNDSQAHLQEESESDDVPPGYDEAVHR